MHVRLFRQRHAADGERNACDGQRKLVRAAVRHRKQRVLPRCQRPQVGGRNGQLVAAHGIERAVYLRIAEREVEHFIHIGVRREVERDVRTVIGVRAAVQFIALHRRKHRSAVEHVQPEIPAFGRVFVRKGADFLSVAEIGEGIPLRTDAQRDRVERADLHVDELLLGRPHLHDPLRAVIVRDVVELHLRIGAEHERRRARRGDICRRLKGEIRRSFVGEQEPVAGHRAADPLRNGVPFARPDPSDGEGDALRRRAARKHLHGDALAVKHRPLPVFEQSGQGRLSARKRRQFHAVFGGRQRDDPLVLRLPFDAAAAAHIGGDLRLRRDNGVEHRLFGGEGQFRILCRRLAAEGAADLFNGEIEQRALLALDEKFQPVRIIPRKGIRVKDLRIVFAEHL